MALRRMSTYERLERTRRGEVLPRRERRELQRQVAASDAQLSIVHPDAAGIDVGSASHFVSVPAGRDERPVREFGSWTGALQEIAAWLKNCGIRTVAMQSTGVYWVALQEILEKAGLEVCLANARGTKNLPGRKSDVQECQWLMKLHTYGLLRNSFRPPEQIRGIRTIWRQRSRLVEDAGRAVQRMQKALTTMNVQVGNAISDLSGVTGMRIVRALLDGERDPRVLAQLRNRAIQASEEELAHSLEGNWREDVLFELRQVVENYDFLQKQVAACDEELRLRMSALSGREAGKRLAPQPDGAQACEQAADRPPDSAGAAGRKKEGKRKRRAKAPRKNQPGFDLRAELHRLFGVDLTRIDGIDVMTAQVILTEVGPDLSAFPSEGDFSSWLELVPRRGITGGKVIRQTSRESKNRVASALRMAAESLSRSDSYLGARYRRFRSRKEGRDTVKVMAHYLACLVYRLLTKGQEYVDRGAAYFEKKRSEREIAALHRKAHDLGLQLIPAT